MVCAVERESASHPADGRITGPMTTPDPDFAWTPQHLGKGIYCSPACGGLCTYAAYTRAIHASAALARKLGPGWKPKVWENLGWHWRVEKGGCQVWLERDGKYRILMNPGIFDMPDRKSYRSARVAVRDQIRHCRRVITEMSEAIQELTA